MKKFNKFLLLASLSPLLIVLFISAINTRERFSLRFLIWTSPEIPLSSALAIASTSSFFIGYLPYFFLTRYHLVTSRTVKVKPTNNIYESIESQFNDSEPEAKYEGNFFVERDVRDPSPTLTVPFKVIKKSEENIPKNNSFVDLHSNHLTNSYSDQSQSSESRNIEEKYSNGTYPLVDDWLTTLDEDW